MDLFSHLGHVVLDVSPQIRDVILLALLVSLALFHLDELLQQPEVGLVLGGVLLPVSFTVVDEASNVVQPLEW